MKETITTALVCVLLSACTNNNSNKNQCGDTGGFGGDGGTTVTTRSTRLSGGGGFGGFGGTCPVPQCDPAGTPGAQKSACDDSDPTTIDRCAEVPGCGGLCVNMIGQCDALDPQIVQLAICNDAETCTADRCDALNVCAHEASDDGTACAGGLCENGICTPTCAPTCPTNAPCKLNIHCASNACVNGLCT